MAMERKIQQLEAEKKEQSQAMVKYQGNAPRVEVIEDEEKPYSDDE